MIHGPDDLTKACIPFHLAANGAAGAGFEVAINLVGDATVLVRDRYVGSLAPLGLPLLRELMAKISEKGNLIYIRGGCAEAIGLCEADLTGTKCEFDDHARRGPALRRGNQRARLLGRSRGAIDP